MTIVRLGGRLLLIIVCFEGLANDQIIIVVSKDPLATNNEFGDHATQLTFALWKPHSCLWAGCVEKKIVSIKVLATTESSFCLQDFLKDFLHVHLPSVNTKINESHGKR